MAGQRQHTQLGEQLNASLASGDLNKAAEVLFTIVTGILAGVRDEQVRAKLKARLAALLTQSVQILSTPKPRADPLRIGRGAFFLQGPELPQATAEIPKIVAFVVAN